MYAIKQTALICFLSLFVQNILGQKELKYADHGWQFAITTSTDLIYRYLKKSKDHKNDPTPAFQLKKEREIPKIGYHFLLGVEYKSGNSLFYGIGIGYSLLGYKTKTYPYEADVTANVRKIQCEYYLDFPLKIGVIQGDKKIQFIGALSFIPSIHVRTISTEYVEQANAEKFTTKFVGKYTEPNLFTSVSTGINYQINEKINLNLSPEFKIGLFRNDGLSHLWSLGLNVGCYYTL